MGLFSTLNPLNLIKPLVNKVTGYIPDSGHEKGRNQRRHQRSLEILKNQVGLAEASSASFFTSGWRPSFMWFLFALVFWNHFVFQFISMASAGEFRLLTIPNELWALLGSIGGIYGIGRSIEKFGAVKRKAEVIKVFQQEYVKSELPKDLDEPENYTPSQVITPLAR
jgi:hypothetical protein